MSTIAVLSGVVSAVRVSSRMTVNTTVNTSESYSPNSSSSSTQIVKHEMINFRINNQPVYMEREINITDGDIVTAACVQKGEFEALAINNHTTKMMYAVAEPQVISERVYIVIGVITLMFHWSGLFLIGGGLWFLANKNKRIKLIRDGWALIEKAQAPSAKPA